MSLEFERLEKFFKSWLQAARNHPIKTVMFVVLIVAAIPLVSFLKEKGKQFAGRDSNQADPLESPIASDTASVIRAFHGEKEIPLEVDKKSIVESPTGIKAETVMMEDGKVHVQTSSAEGNGMYVILDKEAPHYIHLTDGVLYTVVLPPLNDLLSKKEYVEGETGKLELKFKWGLTVILTPRDTGNIRISSESKELDGLRSYGFATMGNAVHTNFNNKEHIITFKYKHEVEQ